MATRACRVTYHAQTAVYYDFGYSEQRASMCTRSLPSIARAHTHTPRSGNVLERAQRTWHSARGIQSQACVQSNLVTRSAPKRQLRLRAAAGELGPGRGMTSSMCAALKGEERVPKPSGVASHGVQISSGSKSSCALPRAGGRKVSCSAGLSCFHTADRLSSDMRSPAWRLRNSCQGVLGPG